MEMAYKKMITLQVGNDRFLQSYLIDTKEILCYYGYNS